MIFLGSFIFYVANFMFLKVSIYLIFMQCQYFWVDYIYGEGVYVILILLFASYVVYIVLRNIRGRTLG